MAIIWVSLIQPDGIDGAVGWGSCEKARRGQSYSSCEIDCNASTGECEENSEEETCGCDGNARFTSYSTNCVVSTQNSIKQEK